MASTTSLTILLAELAALRLRQQIKHCLRRPAQLDAYWRDHDRSVDENGMRHHCIKKLVVRRPWIVELELVVGRALDAHHVTHRYSHSFNQRFQQGAARRRFQILDHVRFE